MASGCIAATAAILLVMSVFAGMSSAAEIGIDPLSKVMNQTAEFSMNLTVSDIDGLYAFQVDVTYDPDVLEFRGAVEGPFLSSDGSGTYCPDPDSSNPGLIDNLLCTRLMMVGGLDGDGVLATLLFYPLRRGTSQINLTNVLLADQQAASIPVDAACSNVCVDIPHRADTSPQDGCVVIGELMDFIGRWKASMEDVSLPELMEAIYLWRSAEGCTP